MKLSIPTFAVLLAMPLPMLHAAGTPKPPTRPNILHINADDHRPDGLHMLGTEILQTPNLDRLVANGMTFSRCYTMGSMSGAVCLPSRTMLLTGRSWLRIPKPNAGNPAKTLPKVLGSAGYETFHVGKGGNEYSRGLSAFETNLIMDDHSPELRRGSSERHADATLRFLKERDKDRPFFIYFAPPVPHDPRVAAPEFHRFYDPAKVPLPSAFLPLHPFDNGEMTVRDEKLAPWPRTPVDTRRQLADYYACITGLDHHIGRIFDALKASGEWENTIVVFTGDNGLSLGEHGLFGKQNLYEFGGMHVPLVVAGPGIPKGRSEALVYLMDLFPTFCDFAGAKVPAGVEGVDIRPVIEGRQAKTRDVLYTGYKNVQRAIRDKRWKLIRYPLVDQTQLFDLAVDPHELNNLAANPGHAAKVVELTDLLQKEMQRYGDKAPLKVANPKPPVWSPPPSNLTTRTVAGWTLHLSPVLLATNAATTERAFDLLAAQLEQIVRVMPAAAVVELRKVPLWFSPEYPGIEPRAEFHPNVEWLRNHGRDPAMAGSVEFTNVRIFEVETRRMPNFALHELAHAYHDRCLPQGFGNTEIKTAWEMAKAGGRYDRVECQDSEGRKSLKRAYALTNPQEYFAETTEAFFTRNDFFPYIREQLRDTDPAGCALMEKMWGVISPKGVP